MFYPILIIPTLLVISIVHYYVAWTVSVLTPMCLMYHYRCWRRNPNRTRTRFFFSWGLGKFTVVTDIDRCIVRDGRANESVSRRAQCSTRFAPEMKDTFNKTKLLDIRFKPAYLQSLWSLDIERGRSLYGASALVGKGASLYFKRRIF